jgi:predicted DNA-binding protein (UPF0251 family)
MREPIDAMLADYETGLNARQIADRYGMNPQTVARRLKAAGVRMRSRSETNRMRRPGIDPVELRRLLDEAQLGRDEMAAHFGVSSATLTRDLRRLGWRSVKGRGSPMEKNYFWKGGRCLDADGYVLVKAPSHPHANNNGYVREHRLVMEEVLGRYLDPKEVVHHKDKDKQNNRPDNLEVYGCNADHLRDELTGVRPNFSEEGLRRIRENTLRVNRRRASASRLASKNDVGE